MMKIIAGEQKANRGHVRAPKDAVIAYLPQHLLTEDNCTVFEEAANAFRKFSWMNMPPASGETRLGGPCIGQSDWHPAESAMAFLLVTAIAIVAIAA